MFHVLARGTDVLRIWGTRFLSMGNSGQLPQLPRSDPPANTPLALGGFADDVCLPVPFYHCFGMVMGNLACTTHGSTIVIPAPRFDTESTLRTCEQERCTSLYGVPTMVSVDELGLTHPIENR